MIWIIFFILLLATGAYLVFPFLRPETEAAPGALEEAKQQRAAVDLDEAAGRLSPDAALQARDALDRRILDLLDAPKKTASERRLKSAVLAIVPAVFLLGGVGVYTQVGSPGLEPISFAEFQAQQAAALPDTLDGLVVELKNRLEADPNPPAEGYVLLARSYLRLGRVEEGLAAYNVAIDLSQGDENIVGERQRVLQMLQERAAAPAIDPDARARIEAMTPDEQAAMIEGMVEGLAVRLEQDPNDIEGWMRLIRARVVMGDADQARLDLASALSNFPADTEEGTLLQNLAAELLPSVSESAEQ